MQWLLNILTNYLRFLSGMIVVFLMTPFIVGHVGVEAFAIWSIIFSVLAIFGLFDLGFATAAVKSFAEDTTSRKSDRRNETLSTLLAIHLAAGVICFTLIYLLAPPISRHFGLDSSNAALFVQILRLVGAAVAAGLPLSVFKAVLVGEGRMHIVNLVEIFVSMANAALTALLLWHGHGLIGVALATAITMFAGQIALVPLAVCLARNYRFTLRYCRWHRLRELSSLSVYFFIINTAVIIVMRADPIILGLYLPAATVATYAIALKVNEYTYLLNKQFANALTPLVSAAHGAGRMETKRWVLVDGSRYLMAISLPMIALVFFHADDLILIWMGPQFTASIPILRILLVATFFSCMQLNPAMVSSMSGAHRMVTASMISSALLNLVLSLIAVRYFGAIGVAGATVAATVLVDILVIIPSGCRQVGIGLMEFLQSVLPGLLIGLAPCLLAAVLLHQKFGVDGFIDILWQGAISALLFFAAFYLIGVPRRDKQILHGNLSRIWQKRMIHGEPH